MTIATAQGAPTRPPRKAFKRFFLRGLALILPTVLTVYILVQVGQFIDSILIQYVNNGIRLFLRKNTGFYGVFRDTAYSQWWFQNLVINPTFYFFEYVLGFLLSVAFVYALGLLMGNLVGRKIWQAVESRLMRFPVVRFVYPIVKQVTDFLFSERQLEFRSVVAVEYPRKGLWSLGFVTARGFEELRGKTGRAVTTVFIPSSPTPVTGYVIFVPQEELIVLDITVDEAFRMIVSGGVFVPEPHPRILTPKTEGLRTE